MTKEVKPRKAGGGRKSKKFDPVDAKSGDWVSLVEFCERNNCDPRTARAASKRQEVQRDYIAGRYVYLSKKKVKKDE